VYFHVKTVPFAHTAYLFISHDSHKRELHLVPHHLPSPRFHAEQHPSYHQLLITLVAWRPLCLGQEIDEIVVLVMYSVVPSNETRFRLLSASNVLKIRSSGILLRIVEFSVRGVGLVWLREEQ
jgi:hypothetical protein